MRSIIIVILFCLTSYSMAQTSQQPLETFWHTATVSQVQLRLQEGETPQLLFTASPGLCEDARISLQIEGQFIEIKTYLPADACAGEPPAQMQIALDELVADQRYVLFLNDYATTFYYSAPATIPDQEAFVLRWGQDNALMPFRVSQSTIDDVFLDQRAGQYELVVNGTHPDACESAAITRFRQDEAQPNLYHAEVLRLLPEIVRCDPKPQTMQAVIQTELPTQSQLIIEASERYYRVDNGDIVSVQRFDLPIQTVDILRTGATYVVVVRAQKSEDCIITQPFAVTETDFASLIAMRLYVPEGADCLRAARTLERTFTVTHMPVMINGRAFDTDGEWIPLAGAQSENATDGNYIAVDTVIDSVDVMVQESTPMQLSLTVRGSQPDGCDLPVEVQQEVVGNTVTIHIYRNVPIDLVCPMVLQPYQATIAVAGTFSTGIVEIQVNAVRTRIDVSP